jgi:hypothetical protein
VATRKKVKLLGFRRKYPPVAEHPSTEGTGEVGVFPVLWRKIPWLIYQSGFRVMPSSSTPPRSPLEQALDRFESFVNEKLGGGGAP